MQNGNGRQEEKLDDALEDSFPASDPVSMTQPNQRNGKPKQHSRTAAQSAKDAARTVKNRAADQMDRIKPDYLWLGGAFLLGAVFAMGAFGASRAMPRRNFGDRLLDRGERMQKRASSRIADMDLKRKLSELLERLQ